MLMARKGSLLASLSQSIQGWWVRRSQSPGRRQEPRRDHHIRPAVEELDCRLVPAAHKHIVPVVLTGLGPLCDRTLTVPATATGKRVFLIPPSGHPGDPFQNGGKVLPVGHEILIQPLTPGFAILPPLSRFGLGKLPVEYNLCMVPQVNNILPF